MVETGSHNHHHQTPSNHAPPPPAVAPPLGSARGPLFPPSEQLLQLHYCIHSNPSWVQTAILAFQHYIVMLGTTVMIATLLVPRMGGGPGDKARVIQSLLFMSGINTLLQTWFGTRLPTVMGPSFGYVISVLAIINDLSDSGFSNDHERFTHTMRAIQGSLMVSSFVNIILGYSNAWGNLTRFISPIVLVPAVCVVGLGLFSRGFPQLGNCIEIGLPMLILLVISQQYLQHIHPVARPMLERFALLVCFGLIWAFSAILTAAGAYNNVREQTKLSCRTDRSFLLSSAPWIKIPYPFQWGTPIFRASHVLGMMGAALVSSAEGENVGLLGLTRVGSRRVVQISTVFMIFFSIFGKFGAFFASIPLPIFAAIYCILYGIVAAVGISFIQFTNNNSIRNIYVLGVSLFLGISIPQYFFMNTDGAGHGPVRTSGGWFNDILNTIFSSPPTVALIVGTLLDNTLEARHAIEDRGLPWLVPFHRRKGDSRNEEFYSYPLRINEYIPSRFL
ncbi:N-terminal acetyltransferase [Orobanche minor]